MIAPRRFWFLLVIITACTILSLAVMDVFIPESSALSLFTVWCLVVFTGINIIAYYTGRRAVRSKSKYRFIQLMMGLILFKMVVCIALVVAHVKIDQPVSKLFVVPFMAIYLIFTLFEIYVLEKMARTNTGSSSPQQL